MESRESGGKEKGEGAMETVGGLEAECIVLAAATFLRLPGPPWLPKRSQERKLIR